jgi:hypothetical protein
MTRPIPPDDHEVLTDFAGALARGISPYMGMLLVSPGEAAGSGVNGCWPGVERLLADPGVTAVVAGCGDRLGGVNAGLAGPRWPCVAAPGGGDDGGAGDDLAGGMAVLACLCAREQGRWPARSRAGTALEAAGRGWHRCARVPLIAGGGLSVAAGTVCAGADHDRRREGTGAGEAAHGRSFVCGAWPVGGGGTGSPEGPGGCR